MNDKDTIQDTLLIKRLAEEDQVERALERLDEYPELKRRMLDWKIEVKRPEGKDDREDR